MKYRVTRNITVSECPWLDWLVSKGSIVRETTDPYGCCGPSEIPVEIAGRTGYYGLPYDALEQIPELKVINKLKYTQEY